MLKFLICGLEHTGTTLISDLFRQVPHLDSGFECGVLLRNSPTEFRHLEPFFSHMKAGWGLTDADLDGCCDAPDFPDFYARLMAASTTISSDTHAIFDKTPRYLSELTSVLRRCDCPVLISHKDPRAIVCSDFKRAQTADFDSWYDGYRQAKLRYVRTCYKEFITHAGSPRVATVGLEDLAMNARATMERMFAHVGETFNLGYAIIDTLRYANVRNRTVPADIAFEYKSKLSVAAQARIMEDFRQFDAWVYEGKPIIEATTSLALFPEKLMDITAQTPRTVVCLGTARGGTSMVAGAMVGLGVPMGTNLPVNIEDPAFNPDQHDVTLESFVRGLPPVITERNSEYVLWGWKFPRAAAYLRDIAGQLRNLHLVVVMRDPIPASLRALKGDIAAIPILVVQDQARMQARNMRLVEDLNCPTLLVSYERASNRPRVFLDELAAFLNLDVPADPSAIIEFMKPGSYKSPPSPPPVPPRP